MTLHMHRYKMFYKERIIPFSPTEVIVTGGKTKRVWVYLSILEIEHINKTQCIQTY